MTSLVVVIVCVYHILLVFLFDFFFIVDFYALESIVYSLFMHHFSFPSDMVV